MVRGVLLGLWAMTTACLWKPELPDSMTPPGPALVSISVGGRHSCGLDGDGIAYCWGANEGQQLGIVTPVPYATAPTRIGAMAWTAISAGGAHTCGIADGNVWCWGENDTRAALGHRTTANIPVPTLVDFGATPPVFTQVSAGGGHTCAIGEGQVWCWGIAAELGNGNLVADVPVQVGAPATDWTAISSGWNHTCAISTSLGVECWGVNDHGQSDASGGNGNVPAPIVGLPSAAVAIDSGYAMSCAVLANRELWCWGLDYYRVNGTSASAISPTRLSNTADWTAVAVGMSSICGLRNGDAYCWGTENAEGVLGDGYWNGHDTDATTANRVGPADAVDVAWDHSFACTRTGTVVRCWGRNSDGDLGIGTVSQARKAVEVMSPNGRPWALLEGGHNHQCATTDDGALWCWGSNIYGQTSDAVARGDTVPCVPDEGCDEPRPVAGRRPRADQIVGGDDYTCIRDGGDVYCWGNADRQQLGSNNPVPVVHVPLPVGTWLNLTGGDDATCVTNDTGAACWGEVAGDSHAAPMVHPDPLLGPVDALTFGVNFGCAHTTHDTRVCWGTDNSRGQTGNGVTAQPVAPFDDMTAAGVTRLAASSENGCLIDKVMNQVACWGPNYAGQAGQNAAADVLAPTPTTTPLTGCTRIAVAADHACAICAGELECWGQNRSSEIGRETQSTSDFFAGPVDTPAGLTFTEVALREGGGCAIGNGRMFCWGQGQHGDLGDGSGDRNLPTPIVGIAP